MVFSIIAKSIGLIAIVLLIICIGALYKAFERAQQNDKASIAWGILFEIILLVAIAIRIIMG